MANYSAKSPEITPTAPKGQKRSRTEAEGDVAPPSKKTPKSEEGGKEKKKSKSGKGKEREKLLSKTVLETPTPVPKETELKDKQFDVKMKLGDGPDSSDSSGDSDDETGKKPSYATPKGQLAAGSSKGLKPDSPIEIDDEDDDEVIFIPIVEPAPETTKRDYSNKVEGRGWTIIRDCPVTIFYDSHLGPWWHTKTDRGPKGIEQQNASAKYHSENRLLKVLLHGITKLLIDNSRELVIQMVERICPDAKGKWKYHSISRTNFWAVLEFEELEHAKLFREAPIILNQKVYGGFACRPLRNAPFKTRLIKVRCK